MPNVQDIIERQLRRWELEKSVRVLQPDAPRAPTLMQPVITVSRQHGSGGASLAARLAERFQYTLLHRDVVDRICASSGTMRRVVESLDEHVKPQVTSFCESLLGSGYLDASDYARHLLKVIRSIAELGGAVVVGRGANFIVGPERGFHVRVVAPREARVRRIMARDRRSEKDALHDVETSDRERAAFIRKLFGRSIDDAGAYDLVINTGHLPPDVVDRVVALAAQEKLERLRRASEATRQPAGSGA
jgi:cytidylate kinase